MNWCRAGRFFDGESVAQRLDGGEISSVLFGWMIDGGASIELIAAICVVWITLAMPATWLGLRYSTG